MQFDPEIRVRIKTREILQLDAQKRMSFGAFKYTLYCEVPINYLCWCRANVDLYKFPNLKSHIEAIKDTLDKHEIM